VSERHACRRVTNPLRTMKRVRDVSNGVPSRLRHRVQDGRYRMRTNVGSVKAPVAAAVRAVPAPARRSVGRFDGQQG